MEDSLHYKMLAKRKARLAQYFDSVLKSFPIPFFTVDIDGHMLRANELLASTLGKGTQELVGMLTTDLFSLPDDWFKQVESKGTCIFKIAKYNAWANSLRCEAGGMIIGYVVTLIQAKEEISFQSNW